AGLAPARAAPPQRPAARADPGRDRRARRAERADDRLRHGRHRDRARRRGRRRAVRARVRVRPVHPDRAADRGRHAPAPPLPPPPPALGPALALTGADALRRGDWREARALYSRQPETPAALLGLGMAARGLFDGDAALEAHERGYRLAREAG